MTDENRGATEHAFRIGFGAVDILSAFVVYLAVFQGLPARYWPVDVGAGLIVLLLSLAGIGLIGRTRWGRDLARVGSVVTLGLGLCLVTVLAVTASYLSGIYGPVGRGGALILTLSAALGLPYLVVLPAAQLVWLGPFAFNFGQKDRGGTDHGGEKPPGVVRSP